MDNKALALDDRSFVVFGGQGSWGSLICRALEEAGKKPQIIVLESTPEERVEAIKNNDVVILAISDIDTFDTLDKFRHIFIHNPGKIFVDCASSKSRFADMLREIADSGTSVCSTHPHGKTREFFGERANRNSYAIRTSSGRS